MVFITSIDILMNTGMFPQTAERLKTILQPWIVTHTEHDSKSVEHGVASHGGEMTCS